MSTNGNLLRHLPQIIENVETEAYAVESMTAPSLQTLALEICQYADPHYDLNTVAYGVAAQVLALHKRITGELIDGRRALHRVMAANYSDLPYRMGTFDILKYFNETLFSLRIDVTPKFHLEEIYGVCLLIMCEEREDPRESQR